MCTFVCVVRSSCAFEGVGFGKVDCLCGFVEVCDCEMVLIVGKTCALRDSMQLRVVCARLFFSFVM